MPNRLNLGTVTTPAEKIEQALTFIASPNMGTNPRKDDYCYQPCQHGLHVCGQHPDGDNFLTIVNLPVRTAEEGQALFNVAKAAFATTSGEPQELVIDRQADFDTHEDFPMSRQMLDRLVRFWATGGEANV